MCTVSPTKNEKLAAVDRLRDKYILTPRDVQFRSYLDRLLQRDSQGNLIPAPRLYTKDGDARGIAVVEPAGGGKTSLVYHGLKTHPALQPRDAAHQPWVARSHFPIPVDQGREVAGRVKRMVHVIALPEFMNCTRPLVDHLFADRLLTPIYYGRPGIKGRTQKSVDQAEIAMLVGKLHAKAALIDVLPAGVVSISKAAEKAKVPAVTVVHLILGGFLDCVVRLAGQEGIGALLVDPEEVKRQKECVTVGLSSMEAFSPLKIAKEVGWRLVDQHQAITGLTVVKIFGPDRSHKIQRFDTDSVTHFRATFTTPAHLAEKHDLQIGEVVRRLKRSGARPAISKAEIGMDFYRVNDLKGGIFS